MDWTNSLCFEKTFWYIKEVSSMKLKYGLFICTLFMVLFVLTAFSEKGKMTVQTVLMSENIEKIEEKTEDDVSMENFAKKNM